MNVRVWRGAGVLLVMLVSIWAGFRVYSSRTPHPPAAAIRVPAGEASLPSPSDIDSGADTLPRPKIPESLPDFTLADRSGKPTSIRTWRGKSLILNFWATWCAPCRREIPLLLSLHRDWPARNFEVVGVAVDHADKVLTYANELKIAYPLLIGEQDALDVVTQLGVESPVFPFTVFTDQRGEVVTLFLGELHRPQVDLILGVVQNLNADRTSLPAARRAIADGLQELRSKNRG
jgi:thiol-disulfide isomerase/thioredoxin